MRPASTTWTILIATLGYRRESLLGLLNTLLPQTNSYLGTVRVLAYWNFGEKPLSHIRQSLVEHAYDTGAKYVSFVDDDDMVPNHYVSRAVGALNTDPDYVGWRMQCYWNGKPLKPTFHSLEYGKWWDDKHGYYRDISHLNPIRASLALLADFRKTDPPEDVGWADQLRGKVHTEAYIDDIMYLYHYNPRASAWRPGSVKPDLHPERPQVNHRWFRFHPESSK